MKNTLSVSKKCDSFNNMKKRKIKALYIIEFDCGVKIGISDDLRSRLKIYKTPWCRPIRQIIYLECQYPRSVESKIKQYFKKHIPLKSSSEFIIGVSAQEIASFAHFHRRTRPSCTFLDMRMADCELKQWGELV